MSEHQDTIEMLKEKQKQLDRRREALGLPARPEEDYEVEVPEVFVPPELWRRGADGAWSFGDIGEPFDDHVRKHLPGYDAVQQLAVSAAMWNLTEGSSLLDIGCATGQTVSMIRGRARHHIEVTLVDSDNGMCDLAAERVGPDAKIIQGYFPKSPNGGPYDVIVALWSLQFIPPRERIAALDRVTELLNPGGLFILAEKTLAKTAPGADLFAGLYADWKLDNSVSPEEVLAKWASLRGQLVPWTAEVYERWAADHDLVGEQIYAWGPFRTWAWWSTPRP